MRVLDRRRPGWTPTGSIMWRHQRPVLWMLVVAVVGVSSLTACTADGAPVSKGPTASSHPSGPVTSSGVSASSHFHDTCTHARSLNGPATVAPTDLSLGVLSYSGYNNPTPMTGLGAPTTHDGSTFYKSGATLVANSSATVTIVSPPASQATIITETGPENGTRSVTYTNCEDTPQWFVGGIALWGATISACVTLEVTTSADPTPQRKVATLNSGKCPVA